MEEELFQMMAGAASVLSAAKCTLVGGHSSEGPEAALGFTITGVATACIAALRSASQELPEQSAALSFPAEQFPQHGGLLGLMALVLHLGCDPRSTECS